MEDNKETPNEFDEFKEFEKKNNNAIIKENFNTYKEEDFRTKAFENIVTDPLKMVKTKISAATNKFIDEDEDAKEAVEDIAGETTFTAIKQAQTENVIALKNSFAQNHKNDIEPFGGNENTSKGQQVIMVLFRRIFWNLFMATLGFWIVTPTTVLLDIFRGLSFKKVEKKVISGKEYTTIQNYKLGKIGGVIGWILSVVWAVGVGFLIYFFYEYFGYACAGILAINIIISLLSIKIKFKKKKKKKEKVLIEHGEE